MDKDSELIWESYNQENLFWFYHGGSKWEKYNAEVKRPKKGHYEAGAGIYLTNNYETARKYAKGNKIVSKVGISKNLNFAENVTIEKEKVIDFLKTYISPKYRKLILSNVEKYNGENYPAYYLINLSVNYEIGGRNAMAIKDFLVQNNVDVSKQNQSGDEIWIIVHNPKVIKKVIHTKPSDISVDDYIIYNDINN